MTEVMNVAWSEFFFFFFFGKESHVDNHLVLHIHTHLHWYIHVMSVDSLCHSVLSLTLAFKHAHVSVMLIMVVYDAGNEHSLWFCFLWEGMIRTINLLDLRTVSRRITHPFAAASSCSVSDTTSLRLHTRTYTRTQLAFKS